MIAALTWAGAHARFIMAGGCVVALFLPALSAGLRPALPVLVAMVLAMAVARIDLGALMHSALRPRRLAQSIALVILLMPVTGALYLGLARLFGLDAVSLVLLAAAPPIASATGLALLLGFQAARALELTIGATILTPVIGPVMVGLFLPEFAPISGLDLGLRLALIIAGGFLWGAAIRYVVGAARITSHKSVFDGLAALGMVLFVIPLFDGVGATILAAPGTAAATFALAVVFNLGIFVVMAKVLMRAVSAPDAGTLALVWGNRTVAIYLAALPPDPGFTLFVALYQFPMYFTPLAVSLLRKHSKGQFP